MKHKVITILICIVVIFGVLPVTVKADSILAGGRCGENLTWTLNSSYVLIISGEGEMYDFDLTMTEWDVHYVLIEDGVTSIGSKAFVGRDDLMMVIIPDSVTKIGDYAFYGCESLTSIEIPHSVKYIGDYAFENCENLKECDIPVGVEFIGRSIFAGTPLIKDTQDLAAEETDSEANVQEAENRTGIEAVWNGISGWFREKMAFAYSRGFVVLGITVLIAFGIRLLASLFDEKPKDPSVTLDETDIRIEKWEEW
ncbi:MAG: leucine-rich repeat domain-containing protein [Ruminococcaceae bacterium]|nr:leucine-rich repeat domain-containing protein [Oscillospiraceae bacterium]